MQTSVLIRPARPEDIDAMAKLISLVFLLEEDFTVDINKQRQGLRLFFENPAGRCLLVAEYRHKVVGMCSAQLLASTAEGGWKAIVEDVVVEEAFRGRGIAKKMLSTLEEWANSHGVKRLDLLADRANIKALDFYDKTQWERTNLIALQKKKIHDVAARPDAKFDSSELSEGSPVRVVARKTKAKALDIFKQEGK